MAFDQLTQTIYDGPASGYGADAKKLLRERRALGASNLEAALALAPSLKRTRVVLVSDGVVTAGTDGPDELAAKVKGLKAAGIVRLDAIAVGGLRDDAMLHRLVTAGLPQDGAVIDSDAGEADIVRRLEATTRSKIPVAVEGATFQWPKVLDAMQTGDEALIFAELPKGQPVRIKVGGQTVDTGGLGEVSVAMLERAVAQAKIESLTDAMNRAADGPKDKERYKAEITGLSTKYRVLSPFTALLVLETEADYARFGIDRKALADVLGIENGRVIARHRAPEPEAPKVAVASPSKPQPAKAPVEKKAMRREAAPSAAAAATDDSFGSPKGGEVEVAEEEASKEKRDESTMAESAPSLEAPSAPPPPRPSAPAPASSARLGSSAGAPGGGSAGGGVRAERRAVASPPRDEISDGEARPETPTATANGLSTARPRTPALKRRDGALVGQKSKRLMTKALGWREEDPGDVLALIAIGEAAEALHDLDRAARAYGSIIDLFPARADLRRYAGARLERLANGLGLATDTFRHALDQRPDHPESARLLAYALLKQGKAEQAFTILATARARSYPSGRFAGIERILSEDLGLAAAVWAKQSPGLKTDIENKLKLAKGTTEAGKSIRFVLNWETDANDVDFHIFDAKGGHAFYSQPHLRTGGDLYADVTTGYGPECFTIRGQRTGPYTLQAHYYSRGPMGYGLGKLEIVEHDGQGTLKFEERPFVVMVDSAFVDLGTVR